MARPIFDNGIVQLYQGDVRQVLSELPVESVHCVVTSPPYWGLRDYGLEPLVWGGDDGHGHEWREHIQPAAEGTLTPTGNSALRAAHQGTTSATMKPKVSAFCPCGAWRGSLGLEPTIDLYVEHIVEIFREVRRVLRKDGTLWLNMGDSYAGSGKGQMGDGSHSSEHGSKQGTSAGTLTGRLPTSYADLKPKDLCMMPARVALALQMDGWWLRSDIVWSKPNPMPESVTDRPTRAHEYVFLLTKAATYYYDADAIREPATQPLGVAALTGQHKVLAEDMGTNGSGASTLGMNQGAAGRNKRSVWEIATEPYPEAHFATFPQKLVEPCILAGTSERGGCPDCGAPRERVIERQAATPSRHGDWKATGEEHRNDIDRKGGFYDAKAITTCWRPTCDCGQEQTVPATVLDPFAGSGTVAYVAQRLGRRAIGIDLSAEYLALAEKRMRGQTLPMPLHR